MNVRVISMRAPSLDGFQVVNCCSNSFGSWSKGLSPFLIGPVPLYDGMVSKNMENAWQFSKVYAVHADQAGNPSPDYWVWAKAGWDNPKAVRYPMGRGAKPLYSYWKGQKLSYVEARKAIYLPLYRDTVAKTDAFQMLKKTAAAGPVALRDFDGYDHVALGLTLQQVLDSPVRKMGHAFVLAMMLEGFSPKL